MQFWQLLQVALLATVVVAETNPLAKVIEMLDGLEGTIEADANQADKDYRAFVEWCDDSVAHKKFELASATARKEQLESKLEELGSDLEVAVSRIEELVSSGAEFESELKDATDIRKKEAEDFVGTEAELEKVIGALSRAIDQLQKNSKKGAALTQIKLDGSEFEGVLDALSVVVNAAMLQSSDRQKLTAFLQAHEADDDGDAELGAPDPEAYQSKSGSIVDLMEDMKDKAEVQLSDARNAELASRFNFNSLKLSLEARITAGNKELADEKSAKAAAEESKATVEGDLSVAVKAVENSNEAFRLTQSDCIQVAADHEASTKSREEELKVIAEARKILAETTGAAKDATYSFVQAKAEQGIYALESRIPAVAILKRLTKEHHSSALVQLVSRVSAAIRLTAASGGDPFAKVRGLITNMIGKLKQEAQEELTEKVFCDDAMSKTEEKKGELEDEQGSLAGKIEQAAAKSAGLKEDVKDLAAELAKLEKEQDGLNKVRSQENADYLKTREDLNAGLEGVRRAVSTLRSYYESKEDASDEGAALLQEDLSNYMHQPKPPQSYEKSSGAGGSIIALLEVAETDISKNLADVDAKENDAQADYDQVTHENSLTKARKEQDIKYKTQEFKALDKSISQLSGDLDTTNSELAAVLQYYGEIKQKCVAQAEAYEERAKRRDAEIDGLKQALEALESQASFLQGKDQPERRSEDSVRLRGAARHAVLQP